RLEIIYARGHFEEHRKGTRSVEVVAHMGEAGLGQLSQLFVNCGVYVARSSRMVELTNGFQCLAELSISFLSCVQGLVRKIKCAGIVRLQHEEPYRGGGVPLVKEFVVAGE